ncbi:MAG TPA: hypothetical protein VFQ68_26555 [Streptosporangiaceae bacterium]|nr:hypothetical protein [Streptosporangiaceae bacterium]
MKVRETTLGVKLSALCWGVLTLLAPVALAACTSASSTAPTIPSFSPTVSVSGSVSVTASAGNSGPTPTGGSTQTATPHATQTVTQKATTTVTPTVTVTPTTTATPTPTPTETVTPVPTAAPVTGGGGTAGFQDTLLLVAGLAAIVAGAGSIFYRRRINRGG